MPFFGVWKKGEATRSLQRRMQSAETMKKHACEAAVFFWTRRTGLEPATTGSTGRYSNQLSYRPRV